MPPERRPLLGPEDSDEYTFDPTLRIPPLQHPIALHASRRPLPLEPDARVDNEATRPTARLNTRAKALADAKPIEDEESAGYSTSQTGHLTERALDAHSLVDGARKRQKLDLIQLPKPSTKSSACKPPSFGPVPLLLNELHEPPPSAARFPPITASLADEKASNPKGCSATLRSIEDVNRNESSSEPTRQLSKKDKEGKQKRVYLRGRRPWTAEETDDLLRGVGIHGVGKWKSILHHEGFHFHPDRTTVDLKDRYRTCRLNEERAIDRHASQKLDDEQDGSGDQASILSPSAAKKSLGDAKRQDSPTLEPGLKPMKADAARTQDFNISTPSDFQERELKSKQRKGPANGSSDKKQHLPRWTAEEDANLAKGYQKYGFQWTVITKDPEMNLAHRTGPQVRDRFRLKYPLHYNASAPLSLPDAPKRANQRSSEDDPKVNQPKCKSQGNHRQELTWILRDSSEPPQRKDSGGLISQRLDGKGQHERPNRRNSFPFKYLQDDDNNEPLQLQEQRVPDVDQHTLASSGPASLTTGDRSRQTSVEIDDTRNMNIDDLLNDDDSEQHSRLPPFKFPFDNDWSNESISDSVTLPPLLWEDMTSRPLFDLE